MAIEPGLDPILMTQLESFADELFDLTAVSSSEMRPGNAADEK